MQLLIRDGTLLSKPVPIARDVDGARLLADLYAPAPGRVTVRAMMTATLDGAVAGADGTSGSLHDADDSFVFGVLRALTDVVLVGAGTVRTEDYRRPAGRPDLRSPSRRPSGREFPALAIMSRTGRLPASIRPTWPTLLLTPPGGAAEAASRSGLPADQVIPAEDPQTVIAELARRGHRAIQAEGGPSRLGLLARAGLLDELCLTTTHRTIGGPSPRLLGACEEFSDHRWELRSLLLGENAHIARYVRAYPDPRPEP